jgi:diguanylate cyclase (GGDEF)-like protein
MGELIALLDEIRVELQQANDSLNEALEGLEAAAKLDPLTGLYNRYAFYTLMSDYTQKRKSGSIAIVDLNDLKRINDTYGHHAGDRALLNVAARLQEVVRQADYVFRWGGDEFVLLLFGMPPEAARERMAHCPPPAPLEVPRTQPVALTVSWGVARLQPDVDAALREADAQLYMQKRLLSSAAGRVSSP